MIPPLHLMMTFRLTFLNIRSEFYKVLSTSDRMAASAFEGPSLRDRGDALFGFVAFVVRSLEDPMRSVSAIRHIGSFQHFSLENRPPLTDTCMMPIALRFLIFGTERSQFQSIAAAVVTGIEKTLGADRITPPVREALFSLTMSIVDMILAEYDGLKAGMTGRLYKFRSGRWKSYFTLLTHDKLLLFRDQAVRLYSRPSLLNVFDFNHFTFLMQLTDRKEELWMNAFDGIDEVDHLSSSQPTPHSFELDPASGTNGSKVAFCADSPAAFTHWMSELGRRVKYLSARRATQQLPPHKS
jgi:hypothetical protein